MIPRTMMPARTLAPGGDSLYNKGTIAISPQKPYMTEGIPDKISMIARKGFAIHEGAKYSNSRAEAMPIGRASMIAPMVIEALPRTMGTR